MKPKVVAYEVFDPNGTSVDIKYWDADAYIDQVNSTPLPWSYTSSTTRLSVIANIMVHRETDRVGCRIIVDRVVRGGNKADGPNRHTFCLMKDA